MIDEGYDQFLESEGLSDDGFENRGASGNDVNSDGYYTGKSTQTDSPSTKNGGNGYRDNADWLLKLGSTGLSAYQNWDKEAPAPQRPSAGAAKKQDWFKNPAVIGGAVLGLVLLVMLLKRK